MNIFWDYYFLGLFLGGLSIREKIGLLNEPYKLEILDRIESEPITIYHIG